MKRFCLNRVSAVLLVVVFLILLLSIPAQAASYFSQKFVRFSATAGETLAVGNVITIKDTGGLAWKADADDAALRPAVGVISKGGTVGQTVEVVVFGILEGQSTLTESGAAYLSETAGAITQSTPSYSQQVGVAISATAYLINCRNAFDTTAVTALGILTGATPLIFEGLTADAYETTLSIVDPTADRTVYLPNKTGYLRVPTAPTTTATVLTPGAAVALTVGASTLFTLTPTDNEDSTITFSGAGAVGDEITIIVICVGTADEVITFHATLVSSVGTLTAAATAARYYVVRFISDGTHWFEVSRTAVQT